MLLAACGGGATDDARANGDPTGGDAVAEVSRLEADVAVRLEDDGTFASVDDPTPISIGQVLRTDVTGFAQIDYHDGSLTRLGSETEYTVVALAASPDGALEVRAELDVGRTFHRVSDLTAGGGRYEVATAFGTAAVRGTVFTIVCDLLACVFDVLDGVLELDIGADEPVRLEAGQRVRADADGADDVEEPGVQAQRNDPWMARNLQLDDATGTTDGGGDDGDGAAAPVELPAPCDLIDDDAVSQAAGNAVLPGVETDNPGVRQCDWSPAELDVTTVGLTVAVLEQPTGEFDSIRDSEQIEGPFTDVPDLGDGALLYHDQTTTITRVHLVIHVGSISLRLSLVLRVPGGDRPPPLDRQEAFLLDVGAMLAERAAGL